MSEIKCPDCSKYFPLSETDCPHCGKGMTAETAQPAAQKKKRVACSDGNCTGSIGPDGNCRTCGKAPGRASQNLKKCPYCAETIQGDAIKCRHCNEFLDGSQRNHQQAAPMRVGGKNKIVAALLSLFLGGIGIHRFYLGQSGMGLLYLLFCWTTIPLFVSFFEFIRFLIMSEVAFDREYN